MTKSFDNAKVLCLNVELELKSEKENAEVRISDPDDYQSIVDAEWKIIYDKLALCVECGANVNQETHSVGGQLPLDSEWLETDGPHAVLNEQKRAFLIAHGAKHGAAALAAMQAEAAEAAAKAAAADAAEAALDERLREARQQWQAERVPTWDDEAI